MMAAPFSSMDSRVPDKCSPGANPHLLAFDFSSSRDTADCLLGIGEVHLWHGTPADSAHQFQDLLDLLAQDERERMARFHFQNDRRDFAFARGMLRTVLGRYLHSEAKRLCFSYSEHGKPHLAGPYSDSGLEFNLSHSGGRVLIGVCLRHQIGVDIEQFRDDIDVDGVSERFFSTLERAALRELPLPLRRAAFFHCWTRKEALVKAQGDGLTFPLDLFDVSIGVAERKVSLETRPDPAKAGEWRIYRVPVPEAYAAAVAVRVPAPWQYIGESMA
ncbi:MAG: 4'-phosphopantetheinyl transferase superfamily protein [Acidobacteria bacterium]|nr:4'-phosphopantetheinyl transferase superfamily protein [Acidobacteriota bacterium]